MLTVVEAVDVAVTARRAARRIGQVFRLDDEKLKARGLTTEQVEAVHFYVAEIERAVASAMDDAAKYH